MFAEISSTLMIGKRLCGLRSLSGINTKSRGQSNQNRQKDKAWEHTRKPREQSIVLRAEVNNFFQFSMNVKFLVYFSFSTRKHCARVAGVIIKHVRAFAKFWSKPGSVKVAARQKVHARPGNGSHYFKNLSAGRGRPAGQFSPARHPADAL